MALAARGEGPRLQEWSPRAVIELALAAVQKRKAGWTRADLVAEINAALPDYLGLPDGADVARLLDTLTDEAIACVRSLDRARPGDALLPEPSCGSTTATPPTSAPARRSTRPTSTCTPSAPWSPPRPAAVRWRCRTRSRPGSSTGCAASGVELGVDQAAAVHGVLTSGARVESLVGPAGTGKSFVVGAIARGWTDPALHGGEATRRVFGLATSQIATDVLIAEGLTARNVPAWLATQDRLAAGPGSGQPQPVEGDEAWRLHAGDLVVVDESAMTDTAALAAIHRHVDAVGAKLLLVGDHKQLAAVGAGGGHGPARHRRDPLRAGRGAPVHPRLGARGVAAAARRRPGRAAHLPPARPAAGRRHAGAGRAVRRPRVAGRHPRRPAVAAAGRHQRAGRPPVRGAARRARPPRPGHRGRGARWPRRAPSPASGTSSRPGSTAGTSPGSRATGAARSTARPTRSPPSATTGASRSPPYSPAPTGRRGARLGERMVLPASYVARHLALAYAATVHAAQGQTVDSSHAVITAWTSLAALYVALSRGRDANTAHVATIATVDDPAQGSERHQLHRDPIAVLAGLLDARRPDRRPLRAGDRH